jgi:hypothetical protein
LAYFVSCYENHFEVQINIFQHTESSAYLNIFKIPNSEYPAFFIPLRKTVSFFHFPMLGSFLTTPLGHIPATLGTCPYNLPKSAPTYFCTEGGGSTLFRNVAIRPQHYTASEPGKLLFVEQPPQ